MYETTEPNLSASEIDAEICALAKKKGALDLEIARWILKARRESVHKKLGMGSFFEYVERRLGLTSRQTKDLLRMADKLERLPRVKAALESGKLSTSAVREIVRVAAPATDEAWATAPEGLTLRQVEKLVSGRKEGDLPTSPRDPMLEKVRMIYDFAPEDVAVVIEAMERKRKELGGHSTPAQVLRAIAEDFLGAARRTADEPAYQAALTICTECKRTWRHAGGEAIEVPECVGECALCDGEIAGVVEINEPGCVEEEPAPTESTHVGQPTSSCTARCVHSLIKRGGVRALLREVSATLGVEYNAVSPRVRGLVLARDNHRCSVPGCRNHLWIEIHHLIRPEDGGNHTPENLTVLCSTHHRLFHDGSLAIEGKPSEGLTFKHAGGILYGAAPTSAAA